MKILKAVCHELYTIYLLICFWFYIDASIKLSKKSNVSNFSTRVEIYTSLVNSSRQCVMVELSCVVLYIDGYTSILRIHKIAKLRSIYNLQWQSECVILIFIFIRQTLSSDEATVRNKSGMQSVKIKELVLRIFFS